MKFCLVVTQGSSQGKELHINKAEFVVGRDNQCHLRPASNHVSKRHCILRIRGEQAFVEDLKSTNGTFVNDTQVAGERELHDGDRLKIGPLDFVVRLETAQVDKPTQVEKETRVPPAPRPFSAKKPAAPAKPAPAKAPVADAKGTDALDDDAIGSMLLSLAEDERDENSDSDLANGSTVMQVLKPEELEKLQNATEREVYRPSASKQGGGATSSSAAKAILEKYRRRPKS